MFYTTVDSPDCTRTNTGSALQLLACIEMSDPATDDARRQALVYRDRVVLFRIVRRVAMRLAIPVAGYAGIVLRRADTGMHEVVLGHADRDLDVVLASGGEEAVLGEGDRWARELALPLLIEGADGRRRVAPDAETALATGRPRSRRRKALLSGRRPRFLVRRKAGRMAAEPRVHRSEREIIARN